jgi:hypothetical protein
MVVEFSKKVLKPRERRPTKLSIRGAISRFIGILHNLNREPGLQLTNKVDICKIRAPGFVDGILHRYGRTK